MNDERHGFASEPTSVPPTTAPLVSDATEPVVATPGSEPWPAPATNVPTSSGLPVTEYEPAPVGAAVSPVLPPARPVSRLRWGIALLVAAAVLAVSAAGAWLLTGSQSASGLAAWMPADSVVYVDARFDLPGDQRQKLGNFLAHLPGFKDQSILDQKLAEVYDRAIRAATNDKHDYSSDIRPWFGGQVAYAIGNLPAIDPTASAPTDVRMLAAVSLTDRAAASSWLRTILADMGASYSSGSHAGVDELLFGSESLRGAVAVLPSVMLLGDETSVDAAIDRNGSNGLAASDTFGKAQKALSGDHLAGMYVNARAYLDWYTQALGQAVPSMMPDLQSVAGSVPAWIGVAVRAEDDALVYQTANPHAGTSIANAPTALAAHVPASTVAFLDTSDLGARVLAAIDLYRSMPSMADAMSQADRIASAVGGFDKALGWIGETAIVVDRDGSTPRGGIVIAPKDRAAADQLATQIKNFAVLAGSSVSLHDEPYAGTTITIADLGGASSLNLPSVLSGDRIELAWAITDQVAVIGLGDGFVKQVLDTTTDTSLASSSRIQLAGGSSRRSPISRLRRPRQRSRDARGAHPEQRARPLRLGHQTVSAAV